MQWLYVFADLQKAMILVKLTWALYIYAKQLLMIYSLINYDRVYYIMSMLQYVVDCYKSAYFISIFLQLEEA